MKEHEMANAIAKAIVRAGKVAGLDLDTEHLCVVGTKQAASHGLPVGTYVQWEDGPSAWAVNLSNGQPLFGGVVVDGVSDWLLDAWNGHTLMVCASPQSDDVEGGKLV